MKTPHTRQAILSLLSVSLLTISAASAQITPPDLGAAVKHSASKQQIQDLASKLSVPEKLQLRAATKKVHNDPQMVAARQAVQDAQTK
ncbi:MAG: hypothetical protein WCO97_08190, partial [bacterium]